MIAKRARLLFEHVRAAPNQPLFLLELDRLSPSSGHRAAISTETPTELAPGRVILATRLTARPL
jgi:hypothetical protein